MSRGQGLIRSRRAPTARLLRLVPTKDCIVIVEPDDLIRELLKRWLAEAGYGVVIADADGQVGAVRPKLVIADVSGADSAKITIKRLRAGHAAPIIALSARFRVGLGGSADAAQQLGVRNVLPKPFTREQLLAAVAEAIQHPDTP